MKQQPVPVGSNNWDPGKPLDSFKAFAASIHEQAKQILVSDKHHAEMLFFMPLNGQGHAVPWVGDDRDALAKWMRRHIREHYIYGIVHVGEVWVRFAETGPNDHVLKQVIAGEIRVSELRPEDRREALSVTAQTRDGYSHNWIDEMLRIGGSDAVILGECREFDDLEGRFGNLFR